MGLDRPRPAARAPRRAVRAGGPRRPAADRETGKPLEARRGRGEPLVVRRKPARPVDARVGAASANGPPTASRAKATMVAIAPVRLPLRVPPSGASSTFELTGGDDWLGPLAIERVDRPSLAEIKLRVKEPGAASSGFRSDRRSPPAPGLPARHRGRADPGRQPSRSRTLELKVQSRQPARAEADRRPDASRPTGPCARRPRWRSC